MDLKVKKLNIKKCTNTVTIKMHFFYCALINDVVSHFNKALSPTKHPHTVK